MGILKNDIKYAFKMLIGFPMALLFGLFSCRKGFDKMIVWINKDR